jgi:ABC-type phosphate transport system substrate-binding protein
MRNIRKVVAAVGVAVVASLTVSSVALAESINGEGATFPQNFLANAEVAFNAANPGDTVSYKNPGGGSGSGKKAFKAATATSGTDYAGTDSAVSSSDAASFDWTYVPYVGGAIALGYRLDELQGATLSLSTNTLNGIFAGLITKWNDPSIAADMKANPTWTNTKKASDYKGVTAQWQPVGPFAAIATVTLNPSSLKKASGKKIEIYDNTAKKAIATSVVAKKGEVTISVKKLSASVQYSVKVDGKEVSKFKQGAVTLPDKTITVAYRGGTSGTTNNFTLFMKSVTNPDWTQNDSFTTGIPGGNDQAKKQGSRFQSFSGTSDLANYVKDNNGTIGYMEVSFVNERAANGVKAALIKNAAGIYTAPTSANTAAMLAGSTIDDKGFVTFDYKQTKNTNAYPIVAVTYALGKQAKSAKNALVAKYFKWIIETYAPANAEGLGYAPLTGALKTAALAKVALVNSK